MGFFLTFPLFALSYTTYQTLFLSLRHLYFELDLFLFLKNDILFYKINTIFRCHLI